MPLEHNLEPFLTHDIKCAILAHLKEESPRECCGLITLSTAGEYTYERRENVATDPVLYFNFDKPTQVDINRNKSVVAFVHSHPLGPAAPSGRDCEVQQSVKKPSVIAYGNPKTGTYGIYSFGDHLLDAPLVGREFIYNQFDCLFALRSWVWQNEKRYMPPGPPNDDGWWKNPEKLEENPDLYEKGFKDYGYFAFEPDLVHPSSPWHPKIGDVLLMQLGAPVISHAAVYVGNNTMYHHLAGKLSTVDAVGYLLPYVRKWCRHESNHE